MWPVQVQISVFHINILPLRSEAGVAIVPAYSATDMVDMVTSLDRPQLHSLFPRRELGETTPDTVERVLTDHLEPTEPITEAKESSPFLTNVKQASINHSVDAYQSVISSPGDCHQLDTTEKN